MPFPGWTRQWHASKVPKRYVKSEQIIWNKRVVIPGRYQEIDKKWNFFYVPLPRIRFEVPENGSRAAVDETQLHSLISSMKLRKFLEFWSNVMGILRDQMPTPWKYGLNEALLGDDGG